MWDVSEVDINTPWFKLARDYAIPLLVWLWMVRFLAREVIIPFFSNGMHRRLQRAPGDEEGAIEDTGTALLEDVPSEDLIHEAAAEELHPHSD
jgi:hypothetical protein